MSSLLIRRFRHFFIPPNRSPLPVRIPVFRHISATAAATPTAEPDPKSSLSARLSFVFDQIDALERQRDTSAKDEALQRIRAWRLEKQPPPPPPPPPPPASPSSTSTSVASVVTKGRGKHGNTKKKGDDRAEVGMAEFFQREVEVVHPWPEWIELMERLASQNYFDYRREEQKRVASKAGIDLSVVKSVGLDLTRNWSAVRAACMNFGRDRFDIFKSLSRKDIQTLVGHGCPNMSPRVVFSAKLLRKHVHIDEGDVCSSCNLRNTCSRGYILVPKEDEARTLDVMRILLTYGFDHVKNSIDNDTLRKMKSVKTVVRKLLHEVVKLSAVPRDPNLLPPVIKKPPKVKQPPPPPKRRVGRDDIEMKKGDWLCTKCDFMNFAKNTVCLQCDAKRPKRQLLPGEWECPKCNFLNYRRNISCFQCEHTRPPDEFTENQMQRKRENQMQRWQEGPTTRLQRPARTSDVSNAWNFDFDDDESDGADVAAFEFADSSKAQNSCNLDEPPHRGSTRGVEDDIGQQGRGQYLTNPSKGYHPSNSHITGFDDFDDEEDNLDNYELVEANDKETHEIPRKSLSEFESGSESEDFDDHEHHAKSYQHRKEPLSDSEDDVVVSTQKDSEHDMHGRYNLKHGKKGQQNAGQNGLTRGRDLDFVDESGSDFDDDLYPSKNKNNIAKDASERIGRNFQESWRVGSINDGRKFSSNDLYSRGSRGKGKSSASEGAGRRFQDSGRFGPKNVGKASISHRGVDKFEQRGSNVRRTGRFNQSNDGPRGFQKSRTGSNENGYASHNHGNHNSARIADHSKTNYRQHKRNNSTGFNNNYGVGDNNRRRRIIER